MLSLLPISPKGAKQMGSLQMAGPPAREAGRLRLFITTSLGTKLLMPASQAAVVADLLALSAAAHLQLFPEHGRVECASVQTAIPDSLADYRLPLAASLDGAPPPAAAECRRPPSRPSPARLQSSSGRARRPSCSCTRRSGRHRPLLHSRCVCRAPAAWRTAPPPAEAPPAAGHSPGRRAGRGSSAHGRWVPRQAAVPS